MFEANFIIHRMSDDNVIFINIIIISIVIITYIYTALFLISQELIALYN